MVAFLIFVYIACSILGATMEWGQLGPGEQNQLSQMFGFTKISSAQSWGILEVVTFLPTFFSALFQVLTMQFSFLSGSFVIVWWLIFAPIVGMIIFGLILAFSWIFKL